MGDFWGTHPKSIQEASKVGMRRDDQPPCACVGDYSRGTDPRRTASIPSMESNAQVCLP